MSVSYTHLLAASVGLKEVTVFPASWKSFLLDWLYTVAAIAKFTSLHSTEVAQWALHLRSTPAQYCSRWLRPYIQFFTNQFFGDGIPRSDRFTERYYSIIPLIDDGLIVLGFRVTQAPVVYVLLVASVLKLGRRTNGFMLHRLKSRFRPSVTEYWCRAF